MQTEEKQSLLFTLHRIICEELDVDEDSIRPESKWEQLGADSLDRLAITFAIEKTFPMIEIPHTIGETLNTVGQTFDYLVTQLPANDIIYG